MPFVGHLPEVFLLLVLALIVFGPKRMIEMGSQVGKALGEMRQQLREVRNASGIGDLGDLMNPQAPQSTPFSVMSQFAQNVGTELHDEPAPPVPLAATPEAHADTAASNRAGPIVEGTLGSAPPAPPAE